ncbi:hypothetical protein SAMN03080615_01908 [Amphritea atlantica]|uniref:Uncharacterized protein n=1 Tax=Amphritea atlantica TaxID=355243 RepID=A0A1H9GV77_9GAMM|nr:hypothetical protein [Amphritea atlantica]SEQ53893.1 hypothetical protein SAMN03080615_01908 [Amphritea atlantica]
MNIRCLPHLNTKQAWLDFCKREVSSCFIESPEAMVDFQTTYLMITVLDNNTRHGKQAIKYSLGSRSSLKPAWKFIQACDFNLQMMIDGLAEINFDGNVRDNSLLKAHTDLTVRKFFSKDRSIISPGNLGRLIPLTEAPSLWTLPHLSRLLANQQFRGLRSEQLALPGNDQFMVEYKGIPAPEAQELLVGIINQPEQWQVRPHPNDAGRLIIVHQDAPLCSFEPDFTPPTPKLAQRGTRWTSSA